MPFFSPLSSSLTSFSSRAVPSGTASSQPRARPQKPQITVCRRRARLAAGRRPLVVLHPTADVRAARARLEQDGALSAAVFWSTATTRPACGTRRQRERRHAPPVCRLVRRRGGRAAAAAERPRVRRAPSARSAALPPRPGCTGFDHVPARLPATAVSRHAALAATLRARRERAVLRARRSGADADELPRVRRRARPSFRTRARRARRRRAALDGVYGGEPGGPRTSTCSTAPPRCVPRFSATAPRSPPAARCASIFGTTLRRRTPCAPASGSSDITAAGSRLRQPVPPVQSAVPEVPPRGDGVDRVDAHHRRRRVLEGSAAAAAAAAHSLALPRAGAAGVAAPPLLRAERALHAKWDGSVRQSPPSAAAASHVAGSSHVSMPATRGSPTRAARSTRRPHRSTGRR